jgi:hypothetical protein
MREASHDLVHESPLTPSWLNTEMAGPTSGVVKTEPSSFPNRTIRFPWTRPILLLQEVCPTNYPGHHRSKIQKVRIVIDKSIIRCLTFRSARQCLGHGGAPPMMYPPCPPWVRWYGLWALPPMHFHLGCSGLARGFGHGGYQAEDDRYGGVVQQQTKQENRQSGIPNRTIRFPRRQQKLQGSHTSNRCEDQRMLGVRGTIKIRKGRRVKLRPMTTKRSPTRRRVHMWLQRSRTKPKTRRQRS